MRLNLQKGLFLECMIKFIEIYAQTELGSDYIADISKIAKWVENYSGRVTNVFKFQSREEIYEYLENQMLDGMDIRKFCKIKYI